MSYELRLKKLRESWMEIQELRESKAKYRLIQKKAEKEVRRLSQLIPKKLNQFNETMV